MKFLKLLVLASSFGCMAQDSLAEKKVKVDFSGFLDTYYSYDFDAPEKGDKQSFLYNYNRQNEYNLNIGLLRATLTYDNVYAKIAFHAGSYVKANYSQEDVQFLNEAYLGVYLDKNRKTVLEAGILPSYIGFESATTHANLTLTRSMLAENSPYYMTGIKVNRQFNDKWSGAFLVTNGWQRIKKIASDLPPTIGTQLIYKPSENSTLNWSTFIGKEVTTANDYAMRYFNNLYWDYSWNSKWRTIIGFDYGLQDLSSKSDFWATWFSPVAISQYKWNSKWNMAYRVEYFQDVKNAIVNVNDVPFKTLGNSINIDFLPNAKAKIRTEAKWYHATENLFDGGRKKDNFSITSSLSFEF